MSIIKTIALGIGVPILAYVASVINQHSKVKETKVTILTKSGRVSGNVTKAESGTVELEKI